MSVGSSQLIDDSYRWRDRWGLWLAYSERAHIDRFAGHSFCDTDGAASGFKAQIEALDLPNKQRVTSPAEWRPFNPATQFHPYESRTRWVRTFNDADLQSNYFRSFATVQPGHWMEWVEQSVLR